MLVLSRRVGQKFTVGEAEITIVSCEVGKVRLGIVAPQDIQILRDDAVNKEPSMKGKRRFYADKQKESTK